MFEERLVCYQRRGQFTYSASESLKECCNAPTDAAGLYLIYREAVSDEGLLYIGVSGTKAKDGNLKVRKAGLGGIKDRIVNGHHPKFDKKPRRRAFPNQMKAEGIARLVVFWWVTYDEQYQDFPTDVESELTAEYRVKFGRLPPWHKQEE